MKRVACSLLVVVGLLASAAELALPGAMTAKGEARPAGARHERGGRDDEAGHREDAERARQLFSGLSFLMSSTSTNDCSSVSTSRHASATSGFAPTM